MLSAADFQSYAGPGDRNLPRSEISGYQPVSRIGEVVVNAFVDSYEWPNLPQTLDAAQLLGTGGTGGTEVKPMFHEWATVQPGAPPAAPAPRQALPRRVASNPTQA